MKLLFALCDVRIYVLSRTRRCDNVGQISHRVKIVSLRMRRRRSINDDDDDNRIEGKKKKISLKMRPHVNEEICLVFVRC